MQTTSSVRQAFDLAGKVALVTGAGSGIGRATAQVLAAAGAQVLCADLHEAAACQTASAINAGAGPELRARAVGRRVDVSDAEAVGSLVDALVRDAGRLDVMCNIAGIMVDSPVLDLSEADLDRILAVNLKGVLFGCQAAGRVMVAQGSGSIVNMASAAVLAPAPGIAPYAITKAAVVQLTRTMATEVGPRGVRVNAIAPGFVPTPMTARYYTHPDGTEDPQARQAVLAPLARHAPLRRVGTTADIAYCVLYLASEASSFVTGQLLSPNGGVAMH